MPVHLHKCCYLVHVTTVMSDIKMYVDCSVADSINTVPVKKNASVNKVITFGIL